MNIILYSEEKVYQPVNETMSLKERFIFNFIHINVTVGNPYTYLPQNTLRDSFYPH